MLGINSNINSLVAQQNLNGSQNALSQAITRLSSGKRINSAADDAAGLAIATGMQTQINGLTQGVSNANDGVSMIQTANSALAQITSSLQRIRQLAVQASSGGLTDDNRAALQQEVSQQIQEVNRIASQTQYNGKNILDGSAGLVTFQVGANVGQNVSVNLAQNLSAASVGAGNVQAGAVLGSIAVSIDSTGAQFTSASTGTEITQINILSDGKGGYTYTDQNNQQIANSVVETSVLTNTAGALTIAAGSGIGKAAAVAAITANNVAGTAAGTTLGTISGLDIATASNGTATDVSGTATFPIPSGNITSVTVKSDGNGGFQFFDQNGTALTTAQTNAVFSNTTAAGLAVAAGQVVNANQTGQTEAVSSIDISSQDGANSAIESIDNALTTVNNIQASLGAAQNRFTAISTTQQAQSTDLSQAQSQIQDADFAQETANLSKAQVLQQAGISVLAQANSLPQQVLKLLQ
ncbi:MAG TPA: flagellin [Paraburkholderia sp.]|nr:flagellin [Paraburkholderia sp.]